MARTINVNMTGVESYTRCPEGTWLVKLASIEETTVQGSGDDALKAKFEVIKGSAKGCAVYETFSLSEKALWKLKSFLEAIGMKADGKMKLNLDRLEGKTCSIDVIHEEYQGTKRAKIASYQKPEEDMEDEDEDLDDDEDEEEEPPKKASKAPAKKPAKRRPEPEEDEDDDEDDEEEEEPPRKPAKKQASKAPAKKPAKKAPVEDDDDDDDDWEDDD